MKNDAAPSKLNSVQFDQSVGAISESSANLSNLSPTSVLRLAAEAAAQGNASVESMCLVTTAALANAGPRTLLATGGGDGAVRLWQPAHGRMIWRELLSSDGAPVISLSFHEPLKLLLAADTLGFVTVCSLARVLSSFTRSSYADGWHGVGTLPRSQLLLHWRAHWGGVVSLKAFDLDAPSAVEAEATAKAAKQAAAAAVRAARKSGEQASGEQASGEREYQGEYKREGESGKEGESGGPGLASRLLAARRAAGMGATGTGDAAKVASLGGSEKHFMATVGTDGTSRVWSLSGR
ncbi:hypothetical protein T492DRAFT_837094 [Pavlovales sp. CCMP2436]|nr:hypothetical protein T492DRAFT_837094 [Pavlovales sp. CCMP2436]